MKFSVTTSRATLRDLEQLLPLDNDQQHILQRAVARCASRGSRLTPLREHVLRIILRSNRPLGAYDIIAEIERTSKRDRVGPPTVYRSLEFLLAQGLVHRIHSRNAFIARNAHVDAACTVIFICQSCQHAEEIVNKVMQQTINLVANEKRFVVEQQALEISGLCRLCSRKTSLHD